MHDHSYYLQNVGLFLTYLIFFFQAEKTFFAFIKKEGTKEYTLHENGVNCYPMNYPTSHFTARTIPSKNYSKAMYLFSNSHHMSIRDNLHTAIDDLIGYFYVSDTLQENSSAIFYDMEKDFYGEYISDFSPKLLDKNSTKSALYVMNHESHKGIC